MGLMSIKVKSILKGTKLGTLLRKYRWNKDILSKENAQRIVNKYMGSLSEDENEKVITDILDMARKYRFSAEEYFYYHFKDKDENERKTFLSNLNRVDFCEHLNQAKNLAIFDDKTKSAEVFGGYYKRDFCGVKTKKDITKFLDFVEKHNRFILKPISGSCGNGIVILDLSQADDKEQKFNELFKKYCSGSKDGFIVEELVIQAPEMAQFHQSSINTVRIATVKFDEGAEVIAAFFRTGRGGSIVDNAGAGGVFGAIDIKTGTIIAVGDEYGNSYEKHPDTNVKMVGFTIPRWEEAVAIAKELATVVDGNRYAGWDLALTDKGWVMIEGNARGQFVWQIPLQKGFLAETNAILRRLGMQEMEKLGI